MKDWVIPYLKKSGMSYSKEKFDVIKRINFDCLENNTEHRGTFLGISGLLMERLNCNFSRAEGRERKKDEEERVNFTITFCSVLGDLKKEHFEKLSNSKNIFFVYGTPECAYIKYFPPTKATLPDPEESLRISIFEREVACYPWLVARWIIAHELAHTIFEESNDEKVDGVAQGWGFEREKRAFDRYFNKEKKEVN